MSGRAAVGAVLGLVVGGWALPACSEYGLAGPGPAPPVPMPAPTGDPADPVADAGADQLRLPLDEVVLDGSLSYDPHGADIVAYRWTVVERPEGSTAEPASPEAPRSSLFLDLAGTYRLALTVQSRPGRWDPTPDTVVVEAVPEDAVYVQLSWDSTADLDLHLRQADGLLFESTDCNFCNVSPEWGDLGPDDDPTLDWDAVFGFGPEAISILAPAPGDYEIGVHYFGEDGLAACIGRCAPTHAEVRVYVGGALVGKFTRRLVRQGQLWHVAALGWPEAPGEGEVTLSVHDDVRHTDQTFCH